MSHLLKPSIKLDISNEQKEEIIKWYMTVDFKKISNNALRLSVIDQGFVVYKATFDYILNNQYLRCYLTARVPITHNVFLEMKNSLSIPRKDIKEFLSVTVENQQY